MHENLNTIALTNKSAPSGKIISRLKVHTLQSCVCCPDSSFLSSRVNEVKQSNIHCQWLSSRVNVDKQSHAPKPFPRSCPGLNNTTLSLIHT